MRLRILAVTAALVCALFSGPTLSQGADWTLYYEDGMEMQSYDKTSVESPRKGIVRVSIRRTLFGAQEGKVERLEINCYDHTFRYLPDKAVEADRPIPARRRGGRIQVDMVSHDVPHDRSSREPLRMR